MNYNYARMKRETTQASENEIQNWNFYFRQVEQFSNGLFP